MNQCLYSDASTSYSLCNVHMQFSCMNVCKYMYVSVSLRCIESEFCQIVHHASYTLQGGRRMDDDKWVGELVCHQLLFSSPKESTALYYVLLHILLVFHLTNSRKKYFYLFFFFCHFIIALNVNTSHTLFKYNNNKKRKEVSTMNTFELYVYVYTCDQTYRKGKKNAV